VSARKGWSGGSSSTSPASTIVMDGPKRVTAIWSTDYTMVIVIVVAVVAIGGIAGFMLTKQRKKNP